MGVPQASVLGPLSFSLFNDSIGGRLRYSQHMIFADDTQLYLSCPLSQLACCLQPIAYDVNVISELADSNGLSLNLSESKMLIFGSKLYVS